LPNRVWTIIGKLTIAPKCNHKLKSGFARATQPAIHTKASRPTKYAQS